MQRKAYAKAQGVPATWSQEDHGYIARWYSYYSAETCCEDEAVSSAIRKILLAIFILLNFIVLHTTITHGVSWYCRSYEILNERSQQASCIYLVAEMIFNALYLIATVLMYMDNDIFLPFNWLNAMAPQKHTASLLTTQTSTEMSSQSTLPRC